MNDLKNLIEARTNDLSEPIEIYLKIADDFEKSGQEDLITRANFIREQCSGASGEALFAKYREAWGIPNFDEDIVHVSDFKRGFLWCFRDHTTCWSDNQKAKEWFLTSLEGQFARRYEFWTEENDEKEPIYVEVGSYKEILLSLLKDADYDVLKSPVFSKKDLQAFIDDFSEEEATFTLEEIIEDYINSNPNFG